MPLRAGTGRWLPPVLGPIVGGLFGAFAYDLTIGRALLHANAVKSRMEGMDPSYHEDTPVRKP
jgi:glycerol uptake facilitator protein